MAYYILRRIVEYVEQFSNLFLNFMLEVLSSRSSHGRRPFNDKLQLQG